MRQTPSIPALQQFEFQYGDRKRGWDVKFLMDRLRAATSNPITQAGVSPKADNSTTTPEHGQASHPESSESKTDHSQLVIQRDALKAALLLWVEKARFFAPNALEYDMAVVEARAALALTTKPRDKREEDSEIKNPV